MLTALRNKYRQLDFDTYNNHLLVVFAFFLPFYDEGVRFVLMLILFFTVLGGQYLDKLKKSLSNKVVLAFTLYYLLHIAGLLWTEDLDRGLYFLGEMKYLLIPLVFYSFLRYEYVHRILTAFLIGMFFSELYSYGIFFGILNETFTGKVHDPSPFMNHLNYSLFLAFISLLSLGKIFLHGVSKKDKFFYMAFFLFSLINLFIVEGRIGQLLFLFGIFIVIYRSFEKKVIKTFILAILGVTLTIFIAYLNSGSFNKKLNQSLHSIVKINEGDYKSSWGQRVANIIVCIDVFSDHPLIGVGTGEQLNAVKKKLFSEYKKFKSIRWLPHLHSSYFDAMIQFGLLGVISFIYIFYTFIQQRQKNDFLRTTQIILFMMLFFFNFADVSFGELRNGNAIQFIFFMTMITITLLTPQQEKATLVPVFSRRYFYPLFVLLIFVLAKLNWYIGKGKTDLLLSDLHNGKFFKTSRYQKTNFFAK